MRSRECERKAGLRRISRWACLVEGEVSGGDERADERGSLKECETEAGARDRIDGTRCVSHQRYSFPRYPGCMPARRSGLRASEPMHNALSRCDASSG